MSPQERRQRAKGVRLVYDSLKLLLPLSGLLTASCATTRYQTVYCLSHDQALPAEPPKIKSEINGQADHDTQIIAGSAIRLRSWGEGLATILEGCREPAK